MKEIFLNLGIILLISSITIFILNKIKFFNVSYQEIHQKFTSEKNISQYGGIIVFLTLVILQFYQHIYEIIFYILIFFIGLLSDLKKFNSPKYRLIVQSVLIISWVIVSGIGIQSSRIDLVDQLLNNYYFNIFFTFICLITLTNGSNFIDGLNGNLVGYFILVIFSILLLSENYQIPNKLELKILVFVLISLFVLNQLNFLYLGDNGAYLLGLFFGVYLINIHQYNFSISPYYIILLFWYPCFENLFSIMRKKISSKSSLDPDNNHLHQMLYFYVSKKINKNKIISNNISSIIILSYNFFIFLIASQAANKTNFQLFLIFTNILLYILIYYLLRKFRISFS